MIPTSKKEDEREISSFEDVLRFHGFDFDGPKSEFSPSSVDDEALALVKSKAEVFINWMKEASSDDSDDSDSDDSDSDDSD